MPHRDVMLSCGNWWVKEDFFYSSALIQRLFTLVVKRISQHRTRRLSLLLQLLFVAVSSIMLYAVDMRGTVASCYLCLLLDRRAAAAAAKRL